MPIKPENKHRYPEDWKEIRVRILIRDKNCCVDCGLENYATGFRLENGTFAPWDCGTLGFDKAKSLATETGIKLIRIVLTISHNNHIPEDCSDENLASRCQRCHLRYDKVHHEAQRQITISKKKALINQNSLIL